MSLESNFRGSSPWLFSLSGEALDPRGAAKNESPVKAVLRNSEGKDTQFNHGYLLLQNGGRSRYI
jgi:hypothetical protein